MTLKSDAVTQADYHNRRHTLLFSKERVPMILRVLKGLIFRAILIESGGAHSSVEQRCTSLKAPPAHQCFINIELLAHWWSCFLRASRHAITSGFLRWIIIRYVRVLSHAAAPIVCCRHVGSPCRLTGSLILGVRLLAVVLSLLNWFDYCNGLLSDSNKQVTDNRYKLDSSVEVTRKS